jgi:hypothetical protein
MCGLLVIVSVFLERMRFLFRDSQLGRSYLSSDDPCPKSNLTSSASVSLAPFFLARGWA